MRNALLPEYLQRSCNNAVAPFMPEFIPMDGVINTAEWYLAGVNGAVRTARLVSHGATLAMCQYSYQVGKLTWHSVTVTTAGLRLGMRGGK
jgi:hypothetical protein